MRNQFPFLRNAGSPEYTQAQERAEANWIETKRDFYDPLLSIRVKWLPDYDEEEAEGMTETEWMEKGMREISEWVERESKKQEMREMRERVEMVERRGWKREDGEGEDF